MLFKNLVLKYEDQNDEFGSFLPRKARAIKEFTSVESGKKWVLVELREPFIYGQPNKFGNHTLRNTHLLLTPRIQGEKLCNFSFHAHVVLVPQLPNLNSNEIQIDKTNHVAWCVVRKCI